MWFNPDVAFIFLLIGMLGILFEVTTPGASFPGIFGTISILFSVYIFSFYEINYFGVSLLALSLILFIFEIKIYSYGVLTFLGALAFGFGAYYLIDQNSGVGVSMSLIIIASICVVGLSILLVYLGLNAQKNRKSSGSDALIGSEAKVTQKITRNDFGEIIILGERWRATSNTDIEVNEKVIIEKVNGLTLFVKRVN